MTPKDKAKELFGKYFDMKWQSYLKRKASIKSMTKDAAKQFALIAVDEILEVIDNTMQGWVDTDIISYWQEVKQEIQNL